MAKQNTASEVSALIAPTVASLGVSLWDVRFEKEGSQWFLRVFIDKEGGVDIDDCERVSRAIDPLLDEADPIENSYCLEVSSPGIERELVKEEHFLAFIGSVVNVRFIRPTESGKRDFIGTLTAFKDGKCTVVSEDEVEMTFSLSETSYVKLYYDFGGIEENE